MSYIPPFVSLDLPWYERDGLMTWYDQETVKAFCRILTGTSMKQKLLTLISSTVLWKGTSK